MEACPFKSKLTGYDNASVKVYDPNSRSATFIRHLVDLKCSNKDQKESRIILFYSLAVFSQISIFLPFLNLFLYLLILFASFDL